MKSVISKTSFFVAKKCILFIFQMPFVETPPMAGAMLTVWRPAAPLDTDVAAPPSGTMPAAPATGVPPHHATTSIAGNRYCSRCRDIPILLACMLCGGSVHDPPFEQLVCFLRLQHLSPVSLSVNSVDISSIALEIAQFSRPEFKSQNLILYIAALYPEEQKLFYLSHQVALGILS